MVNLITNFIKGDLDLHLNENKLKKKDYAYFYLSVNLKEIPIEFITSFLLGRVFIIINNPTDESNNCVNIFGVVGKRIIQFYFYNLYKKEKKNQEKEQQRWNNNLNIVDVGINYSMTDWRRNNSPIIDIYNNDLIHNIGGLVMNWLREIDLLEIKFTKSIEDYRKHFNIFKVTDRIETVVGTQLKPLNIPDKIPMIVKPSPYIRVHNKSKKHETIEQLGGYLLNKEFTLNELIIPNWRLKQNSVIKDWNLIYKAVNNISSVGYKINKDVLNFIRLYEKNK